MPRVPISVHTGVAPHLNNRWGSAVINDFVAYAKSAVAPVREQLVNQIVSGGEKTNIESLRGQIRGIDRALSLLDEAARKFVSEAAE